MQNTSKQGQISFNSGRATNNLFLEYKRIRSSTEELLEPLSSEDACSQSMPDCSPAKWHAAHTTWFFETFILKNKEGYSKPFDPSYEYLFNSYYNSVGEQYPRTDRGLITRPSLEKVLEYRSFVDHKMQELIKKASTDKSKLITLGLNHEQQHQELLLMDIKHLFSKNPNAPIYQTSKVSCPKHVKSEWLEIEGGTHSFGSKNTNFFFDNEKPVHEQIIPAFKVSSQLVTNSDYLEFIDAGGYHNPAFWLSDGWSFIKANNIRHPLYWSRQDNIWNEFTLNGNTKLIPEMPVCHINFFEADAYATWKGLRLPTEFELEIAANRFQPKQEEIRMHPCRESNEIFGNFFSTVWQWTNSAYLPFPGFKQATGAIGEYNGKFMSNQMVLKGSACITPKNHSRASYRNFFYPHQRWPFTGIRLACSN
ncbi:MAG: hypothetical protein CBC29_09855 [Methylococcaceae bacterium TMED69]|nr:MAG: hypothetical protein CBC29_09855 [Methylococcaceae bacterium TMED69]